MTLKLYYPAIILSRLSQVAQTHPKHFLSTLCNTHNNNTSQKKLVDKRFTLIFIAVLCCEVNSAWEGNYMYIKHDMKWFKRFY